MWEAMLKAEGNTFIRRGGQKQIQFSQCPGGVLNAFQALTILIGKAGQITGSNKVQHIYVKSNKFLKVASSGPVVKNYCGLVWCPTTKNGTWLMRRNGIAMFTGNSRKNIPLQLEAAIRQPYKFANLQRMIAFLQSDDGKNFDRRLLPKWTNEQFGIPTRINPRTGDVEALLMRSWLPAMDLMAIVDTNPIRPMRRTVLSLGHPIPKLMLENALNFNMYTGNKIWEYPGETYPTKFLGAKLSKRQVHNLKTFRIAGEMQRILQGKTPTGQLDLSQRMAGAVGLPKVKSFNVEVLKKRLKFDVNMRAAKIRRKLSRAKRFGDPEMVRYLENILEDTKARLYQQ